MRAKSWGATDIGRVRKINQDRYYANANLAVFAVADGVGGGQGGEVASQMAVDLIRSGANTLHQLAEAYDQNGGGGRRRAVFDAIQQLLERANTQVYSRAQEEGHLAGMATTCSLLMLSRDAAFIGHVGDSRIYLVRDRHIQRITQDHTWVEELVRAGTLKPEAAAEFRYRNVIVRSVGGQASVQVDLLYIDTRAGDRFLLCSDGLSDDCDEPAMLRVLELEEPARGAEKLIELAKRSGGRDNITAVVVALDPGGSDEVDLEDECTNPMPHTGKIAFLKNLFFCRHLSPDEILKLLRYVDEVQARPGQVIVRQGEPGQDLYAVVEGSLDVSVDGTSVNTIGPGGHFGEINLVTGQVRSATVTAREWVRLFRLTRDDFYDLSEKDPSIAIKLLWSFLQTLGHQVRRLSQRLAELHP